MSRRNRPTVSLAKGCEPCRCPLEGVPWTCADHCPEPDCWGAKGHTGLHANEHGRWSTKFARRPA